MMHWTRVQQGVGVWRWMVAVVYFAAAGWWWSSPGVGVDAWGLKGLLGIWMVYAPVRLAAHWRGAAWLVVLVADVCLLGWYGGWQWALLTSLVHLTTVEPSLAPPRAPGAPAGHGQAQSAELARAKALNRRPELIFFDGHCGICHRFVRLTASIDGESHRFDFAPLQGQTLREHLSPEVRQGLPESVVVLTASGRILVKSRAVGYVLERFGGGWRLLGIGVRLTPPPLADLIYDGIAGMRKMISPEPANVCPIAPAPLRERFLA